MSENRERVKRGAGERVQAYRVIDGPPVLVAERVAADAVRWLEDLAADLRYFEEMPHCAGDFAGWARYARACDALRAVLERGVERVEVKRRERGEKRA